MFLMSLKTKWDYSQREHNTFTRCISLFPLHHFVISTLFLTWYFTHPQNSLIDSNASPKVKIMKEEGIGVCSFICSTLEVEGCARAPKWGLGSMNDNQVNYSYKYAQIKQQVGLFIIETFLVHERVINIHELIKFITVRI
jgi:hypothetical protein